MKQKYNRIVIQIGDKTSSINLNEIISVGNLLDMLITNIEELQKCGKN